MSLYKHLKSFLMQLCIHVTYRKSRMVHLSVLIACCIALSSVTYNVAAAYGEANSLRQDRSVQTNDNSNPAKPPAPAPQPPAPTPTPPAPPAPAPAPAPSSETVSVGYYVNRTLAYARAQLQAKGFNVAVAPGCSIDDSAIVYSVKPWPQASKGATIIITTRTPAPEVVGINSIFFQSLSGLTEEKDAQGFPHYTLALTQKPSPNLVLKPNILWSDGIYRSIDTEGYKVVLTYKAADPSIVEILQDGTVIPKKDGTTMVTCTPFNKQRGIPKVPTVITVKLSGITGAYITDMAIVNSKGQQFPDNTVKFKARTKSDYAQLYVLAKYSDGKLVNTAKGDKLEGIEWVADNADIASVDSSGCVRPTNVDGVTLVHAQIKGAGKFGNTADGYVRFITDTGKAKEAYMPQSHISITARFAQDPDHNIVKAMTLSVGDIEALGCERHSYTQLTRNGNYLVLVGEGPRLERVLAHTGIAMKDIETLTFIAADGARRTGAVSAFTRTGYYFPWFFMGHATNHAQPAPTIIAVRSQNKKNAEKDDVGTLSEATRFRLCLGSQSDTDITAPWSLKWINGIDIMLKGKPPAPKKPKPPVPGKITPDGGGNGTLPNLNPGSGDGGQGYGTGSGTGTGSGSGQGSASRGDGGLGSGTGSAKGSGAQGTQNASQNNEGSGNGSGQHEAPASEHSLQSLTSGVGDAADEARTHDVTDQSLTSTNASDITALEGLKGQEGAQGKTGSPNSTTPELIARDGGGSGNGSTSHNQSSGEKQGSRTGKMQVFQMMRNFDSTVNNIPFDNPLAPYFPVAIGVLILGAVGKTILDYKGETR